MITNTSFREIQKKKLEIFMAEIAKPTKKNFIINDISISMISNHNFEYCRFYRVFSYFEGAYLVVFRKPAVKEFFNYQSFHPFKSQLDFTMMMVEKPSSISTLSWISFILTLEDRYKNVVKLDEMPLVFECRSRGAKIINMIDANSFWVRFSTMNSSTMVLIPSDYNALLMLKIELYDLMYTDTLRKKGFYISNTLDWSKIKEKFKNIDFQKLIMEYFGIDSYMIEVMLLFRDFLKNGLMPSEEAKSFLEIKDIFPLHIQDMLVKISLKNN